MQNLIPGPGTTSRTLLALSATSTLTTATFSAGVGGELTINTTLSSTTILAAGAVAAFSAAG